MRKFGENNILFEKPLNFYSSFISFSKENKEQVLEQELVKYYQGLLLQKDEIIQLKNNEIEGQQLVI